jgi:hypothetical protein
MRLGFLTTFTLALILPLAASAQSLGSLGGDASSIFTVSVSPQYPTPHSQATLSFLSSTLDLANSTVKVSVGGKNIYQGSVQPITVPVGTAGSVTNIVVTLVSNGTNYNQILSIQPQDVALIAEPISSTHVLYPGKSLVPLEGDTRIVAVANLRNANGKAVNPSTLSYSWTVDDTQIANSSGIGKSAIIVASPLQYRARDVSVAIMSPDGSLAGGASLTLTPQEPLVRIYANDPLLGIRFDHALTDSYTISGSEATLYAAPFSLPTTNGAPLIQWFLSGTAAQTGSLITLRPTGSGQGNAALSLTAGSGGSTIATANLSLIFGVTQSTNFFGL